MATKPLPTAKSVMLNGLATNEQAAEALSRLRSQGANGATLTPHARKLFAQRMEAGNKTEEEATRAYLAQRQPSERFIDPKDVGAGAVFLCSDAAHEITGAPLPIDGGWLAWA